MSTGIKLDVFLAQRKAKTKEVAADIVMRKANFSLLKKGKKKDSGSKRWMPSANTWNGSVVMYRNIFPQMRAKQPDCTKPVVRLETE